MIKNIDFDLSELLITDEEFATNSSSHNDDYPLSDMLNLIDKTPYRVKFEDGSILTSED